jgi:catechol 2,3-dioxygenase
MIPPDTSIGKVRLRVADLDDLTTFYQRVIGLEAVEREGDVARLGAVDGEHVIELVGAPDAPPAPSFSTGLFHLAILVPDRAELARSLQRVAGAGWRLTGASDHLVSEALYLQDPEGNGIEIYRDRPRETWEGKVAELMTTMPLDLDDILGELDDPDEEFTGLADGTVMGHVHLRVREIPEAVAFYRDALGFGITAQRGGQAAFLSAGGYHHHVGANTWESAGRGQAAPGHATLRRFTVVLPSAAERDELAARLDGVKQTDAGPMVRDPSGNALLLAA